MRQILNISLPLDMVKEIKSEMKKHRFSSVSEFVRAAIRSYRHEIGWRRVQESEREFAEGKGMRLNSFSDLDN